MEVRIFIAAKWRHVNQKSNLKSVLKTAKINSSKIESTYRKSILKNKVRIVTEEIPHVKSLSLGLWIETGSRYESIENNGISHFIEHMVFKGTKKRGAKEIAQSIESVGGYLNAFTSKEHTCYYARVLDEHLELAADVLSDIILSPTFPDKEFEKEKKVILEELKQAEDDPDDIIHDYFEKAVFKSHPLSNPVIGSRDSITSINRKNLIEYKNVHYKANKIVIAAAGKIKHDKVVSMIETYLGNLSSDNNQCNSEVINNIEGASSTLQKYFKPIQQAHICLGTIGCSVKDPKKYALQILNTLLGDGMSSRLFQNIREKYGFAYSVFSFNNMMSDTGSMGVYIGTDSEHIDKCIELVWKELNFLKKKGISRKELNRAKAQLKGSLMLGLENIPNRMIRLATSEIYFGELIPIDNIITNVENVNIDDVQELAEALYNENLFSTIIFHPNGKN